MSDKRTYGDPFSIECPHCGEEICDLWDGNCSINTKVECGDCGGISVIEDYEVTITLRALPKADTSEVTS